ncbi:hypothetical protein MASR2M16_32910 [Thauera terpenica]
MADRHQLGVVVEQGVEGLKIKLAGVIDRCHLQYRARLLAQQLPGHDVGVVLHRGDEDLVAGAQLGPPPALRHEIDGFGGAAGEHDLFRMCGIDELLHGHARVVVELGGVLRQPMHAAVDVGVRFAVEAALGIDHRVRLLRGRAVVQIGQPAAVDRAREDGKVGRQIERRQFGVYFATRGSGDGLTHSSSSSKAPPGRRASRVARALLRSDASAIRSSTSAAKA